MSDAMLMLEWKNYPETRKFTIATSRKILAKDHLKWLPKNLKYFKIIEETGVELGAIRVQGKEVSIWIDRELWGLGYAVEAINMVAKKGYTAKIVEGHINSMRVFISAGFKPVEYTGKYYIFKK